MKKSTYEVFMVLGAIWLIIGLIIYKNMSLWPIGTIFFIVGLIGFLIKKKKESDTDKK
jgi:uncharacterized membrane protein